MGADGGTIPTRCELVTVKKKPEQKDVDSARLYKWAHCALTQEPLQKPVVACELGRMYNKEAIIEKLLNAKSEGTSGERDYVADHIRSLKDVIELQLEQNPAFKGHQARVGDQGYNDSSKAQWICPLTSTEMNGRFPFVFDWSNGKVLSKKACKMLKEDKVSAISEENLIILNPEWGESDADLMKTKMEARRARVKALKKAAKEGKRKLQEIMPPPATSTSGSATSGVSTSGSEANGEAKKSKMSKIPSTSTSSGLDKKSQSLSKSVQKDPSKSEVYKSLFSSHHTALNKPKGNWVTFDPRYN